MAALSASILSADFSRLADEISTVEENGSAFVHIDVMDGHFVPNISFGAPVMKKLIGKTDLPMDVHLMIEDPDKYIPDFDTKQTEYITVHAEACDHLDRTVSMIRERNIKAGVALNPATSIECVKEILYKIDLVLVMSVNPGFGGQIFIEHTLDKVRELDRIRKENDFGYKIEIDGGISTDNLREVVDAGTDLIVAGSSIFGTEDVAATTRAFCEML